MKYSKVLKNFYFRRILRIFPIYYISIVLLTIFNVGGLRDVLPWTLTYTMNIGSVWFGQNFGAIFHFWSLCVEEQFYLFWPLLLLIFRKKRIQLFIAVILLSIITKFIYIQYNLPNVNGFLHDSTPAAMDALAFGALLAEVKREYPQILKSILKYFYIPIILILFFWSILFVFNEYSFFYSVFGRLTVSIIAFYLVGWGVSESSNIFTKIMQIRILRYLGKISYGIYVYHWIIYFLLIKYFDIIWMQVKTDLWKFGYNKWIFTFIIFTSLTIFISTISFYFIEKPLLKLKKRFT